MDAEELAAWLGPSDAGNGGLEGDHGRGGAGWTGPTAEEEAPRGRRWGRIAAAGLGIWLLVAVVLVSTRGPGPGSTADPAAVVEAAAPAEGTAPVASVGPTASGTVAPSAPPAPDAAVAAAPPAALPSTDGPTAVLGGASPAGVGPLLALHQVLAAAPGPLERYLEWAEVVDRTDLGGGVSLLVLDAAWLEGQDGEWNAVRRGRWALPVLQDGTAVADPWPVAHAAPAVDPDPPPVGLVRADEVGAALAAAGWADVVVHGSEAHPDLPAVWRAVVDATGPDGVGRTGQLLWLQDVDGLRVLGATA